MDHRQHPIGGREYTYTDDRIRATREMKIVGREKIEIERKVAVRDIATREREK